MAAESKKKTAFVTPFGRFKFNVMPFGLQGAPSTFQCMMDNVLQGLEECTQDEAGRESVPRSYGYYNKFIPKYAMLAAPLTELTKKQQPNHLVWNAECAEAFEALKRHLCTSPVLKCPDF
ncbi:hypothetical protein EMCRGX_G016726 [Ephydatia muelleri]